MTTNARIYARFSPRRNAAECDSINKQLDACREYCERQKFNVVATYADEAISGTDETRLGLNDCLNALKPGEVIVAWESSRIARSTVYMMNVCQRVIDLGSSIHCLDGMRLDASIDAWFRASLDALLDERERRITSKRTRESMRRHQKNNRAVGGKPPYGWYADEAGNLHPAPSEIVNVRLALKLHKDGMNTRAIHRRLVSLQAKSRTGSPLGRTTVQRLITRYKAGTLPSIGLLGDDVNNPV